MSRRSIKPRGRASAPAESPRENEYRLFDRVTSQLLAAERKGRTDLARLVRALTANQRLWDLLLADCTLEANQLPSLLRAQIVSLALWVSRHTGVVLREGGDIDPLIQVNQAVMTGLAAA